MNKPIAISTILTLLTPTIGMEVEKRSGQPKLTRQNTGPIVLTETKILELKAFARQALNSQFEIPEKVELILVVEMSPIKNARATLATVLGQDVLLHIKEKLESIHPDLISQLETQLSLNKAELKKAIDLNGQKKQEQQSKEELEKAVSILTGLVKTAAEYDKMEVQIKNQRAYITSLSKTFKTAVEDTKYLYHVVNHLLSLVPNK